ncbi:MAG: hypothetical protein ABI277_04570 [Burkholderiaceae bacterium]
MELILGAVLTALAVAGLLGAARHLGQRAAGMLAALPTVTAPTLAWIAHDRGIAFAADASVAGVAACAMLAAFALGYTRAPRHGGAALALLCGLTSAALVAWPVHHASRTLPAALALAVLSCVVALLLMPRVPRVSGAPLVRTGSVVPTAAAAGTLTAAAATAASTLGSFAAGLLSSLPIISGTITLVEHARHGPTAATRFLRGYVGGLFAKAVFGATFAVLAIDLEAATALVIAVLVTGPVVSLAAHLARRDGVHG